jgi:SAM-dependent methyltransferase
MSEAPRLCDYEGSDYQTRFWHDQGREYEDQVERIALRRLLPSTGDTLIDIGAGFGRLAGEFSGYQRVVLFDYSRSLLKEAQNQLRGDPRFIFVAGNWYEMPFVDGLFDALVQVRTIHHAADVPALFSELRRIARPRGAYVLEFASKQHLKAIIRYWSGRQSWSPFALEPLEFTELNFDFHPRWMEKMLAGAGFVPGRRLTVSHFRLPLLKKLIPTRLLVSLDSLLQSTARWWQLTPSLFIVSKAPTGGHQPGENQFFVCPLCRSPLGEVVDSRLICPNERCQQEWRFEDGLYDFKEPYR